MEQPSASSGEHVERESQSHSAKRQSTGEEAKISPTVLAPISGRESRAKRGVPLYTCELCSPTRSFTRPEHLRRHQLTHRPRDLACSVPGCNRLFHRRDFLLRHQLAHERVAEAPEDASWISSGPSRLIGSSSIGAFSSSSNSQMQSTATGFYTSHMLADMDSSSQKDPIASNNRPSFLSSQSSQLVDSMNLDSMIEPKERNVLGTGSQFGPLFPKDQDISRRNRQVASAPQPNRAIRDRAQFFLGGPGVGETRGLSEVQDASTKVSDDLNNLDINLEPVESDKESSAQHSLFQPHHSSDQDSEPDRTFEKELKKKKPLEAAERERLITQFQDLRCSDSSEENEDIDEQTVILRWKLENGRLLRTYMSSSHAKRTYTERAESGDEAIVSGAGPSADEAPVSSRDKKLADPDYYSTNKLFSQSKNSQRLETSGVEEATALETLERTSQIIIVDNSQKLSEIRELKQRADQIYNLTQAERKSLIKDMLETVRPRSTGPIFQDEHDTSPEHLPENDIHNTDSDSNANDSDTSEVESIVSLAISVASSATSIGDLPNSAVLVLAELLLKDKHLSKLLHLAVLGIGPARFQRNFKRLLLRYGYALCEEVTSALEGEVAKFVKSSSARISAEVNHRVLQLASGEENPETPKSKALNRYLRDFEDLSDHAGSGGEEDGEDGETKDQEAFSGLQSLDRVESFLTSSQAFVTFRSDFESWVNKTLDQIPACIIFQDDANAKDFLQSYQCPKCDKAFHRREHQEIHLRKHMYEEPHTCQSPGCGKMFTFANELTEHARVHNDSGSKRADIKEQDQQNDTCSPETIKIQEPHSKKKPQEQKKGLLVIGEAVIWQNLRTMLASSAALIAFAYLFLMISMSVSIEAPGHGVYTVFMSTEIPARQTPWLKAWINTFFSVDWTRFYYLLALVFASLTASELAKIQAMLLRLLWVEKKVSIPILETGRGSMKKAILRETILLATLLIPFTLVASTAQIREFHLDMPLYPTIAGKFERVWAFWGMCSARIPTTGLLVATSAGLPWRKPLRNTVLDWMQANPHQGYCRVSWTCRCGKRLHMQVPEARQDKAIEFARKAAGDDNTDSISLKISAGHNRSLSPSTSSVSSNQYSEGRSSSSESGTTTTEPSLEDSQGGCNPFIPAGTKKYMLLCVNSGRRLIRLSNVDVTDLDDDEEVFAKMRASYRALRGSRSRNPFMKPTTMHYVEFRLLHLQKSLDCVGSYYPNRIPTKKEVINGEYAFNPCPPEHSDVPIDPEVFMHVFTTPGDHLGGMAAEMLPKKLHSQLLWDKNVHRATHLPRGWGFYIVEGIDWSFVRWCLLGLVLAVTVLTIVWSSVNEDVQGGTGIGQYCIGALAMLSTVLLFSGGMGGSRS